MYVKDGIQKTRVDYISQALRVHTHTHTHTRAHAHTHTHTLFTAEVYTDGSKILDNVGAARIIFVNGKLVHQLKFKVQGHYSNNQAERIAILKVLEKLEELQDGQDNDKRVAVYTGRKITFGFIAKQIQTDPFDRIYQKQNYCTGAIKVNYAFRLGKTTAGIEGNELVDSLAKEDAVENGPIV